MADRTIVVRAQWALHGKVLDDEGYQVIACSTGDLSKANFTDALGRFTLGALDALPQVSVSYLQPATRVAGSGYLAIAIHWFADGKQRPDGVGHVDNQGRITTFTSYFCAPYASLAAHQITYLDMHKALRSVTLPARDGPPKDIPVTRSMQRTPGIDALAMRVAPLLLTGAPVCVLDADETSLDERLQFIDTVMGLLPYGFRAKMTAATWTRATNRSHRFRLFFSSEPRAGEKQDHIVSWKAPESVRIPGKAAWHYYRWLDDKVTPLASLAQLTGEASFGDSADSQALAMVDKVRLWRGMRQEQLAAAPPARLDPGPARPSAEGADPVTRVLAECAEHVRMLNLTRVNQDLALLQDRVKAGPFDEDRRKRYRVLIAQFGLLRRNPGLQKNEVKLYETLLTLAFGKPLSYEAFCQVEDCLGNPPGQPVHRPLLEAAARVGLGDLRTKVIVQANLDPAKLSKSLGSRGADGHALIRELARGSWRRKQHGRLFCDATLAYLEDRQGRYSTTEIQRVLLRCGYLAQALRDVGSEQYQVHAIAKLLVAAFPGDLYPVGLNAATASEILADAPDAPTPALLAAVLRRIPATEAPAAWQAFVYGCITRMDLDKATHGELWTRLPFAEQDPPSWLNADPSDQGWLRA